MAVMAVLGSGIMATAPPFPVSENGHEVRLVGTHLDREIIDSIQKTGVYPNLGLKVNPGVGAYQLEDAPTAFAGADVVMCGVNSLGVEWITEQFKTLLRPGQKLLCITERMRVDADSTLHLLSEIIQNALPKELVEQVSWGAVVGPSIVGEVAIHYDTAVVFCGHNKDDLEYLTGLLRTDYYHVWTPLDFVGHETGAATKSICVSVAGFAAGLLKAQGKENDRYVMRNYGSAILTQGQKEVRQFVTLMGGIPETADGLGGVGDMFVTSMGGCNVKTGTLVGQGIPFSQVRSIHMEGMVLEGVAAISVIDEALHVLTLRRVIQETDFPLCRFLYSVVEEDAPLKMSWDKFFADSWRFSGASGS